MIGMSRRNFMNYGAAACAALPAMAGASAPPRPSSMVRGVKLGVQTYSYHDVPLDGADHTDVLIDHMRRNGLYSCELFGFQIEPSIFSGTFPPADLCAKPEIGCLPGKGGSDRNPFAWHFQTKTGDAFFKALEKAKAFRLSRPTKYYESIRRRFDDAGMEIYSFNPLIDSFQGPAAAQMSDEEIDAVFYAAKVLGVKAINTSLRMSMLKRVVPFAEKHRLPFGVHGHSMTFDPDEFSTRDTYVKAFALSPWVWANLDIGHYVASGEDPLEFIETFHGRITNLHVKDRKRNSSKNKEDGATVPWGTGNAPIGQVLRLLRDKRYDIPAFIEIEHMGTTTAVGEVRIAYDFCKRELEKKA